MTAPTPVVPKKGMLFRHRTWRDGETNEAVVYRVTAVRMGSVVYRGIDGHGKMKCLVDDFAKYCGEVLPGDYLLTRVR